MALEVAEAMASIKAVPAARVAAEETPVPEEVRVDRADTAVAVGRTWRTEAPVVREAVAAPAVVRVDSAAEDSDRTSLPEPVVPMGSDASRLGRPLWRWRGSSSG